MPGCCSTSDYRRFFNRRFAARDADRYRRRGLTGSARTLAELAGDVAGASVLEVGGGIGAIELELLSRGAEQATNVELSGGYEDEAARLLAERGYAERVERRIGDFVEEADGLRPHDVVLMHRVVCCYPDVEALVGRAAATATRRLLLTYPQERAALRAGSRVANLWLRLRRCGLRTYVHPRARIDAAAVGGGLSLERRERHGLVWESAAYSRVM